MYLVWTKFFLLSVVIFFRTGNSEIQHDSACDRCQIKRESNTVKMICNETECTNPQIPMNITDFIYVRTVKTNSDIDLSFLCYKNFSKLHNIDLSENDLKLIPEGCFRRFSNLQTLNISRNFHLGLQNVYNACAGLNETKIEVISANHINNVDILFPVSRNLSIFLANTSLREFHFEFNGISVIKSGVIEAFPRSVELISISGNRIHFGPVFLELRKLVNLKTLDISFQCTTMQHLRKKARVGENSHNCSMLNETEDQILDILPPNLENLISTETGSGSYCFPKLSSNHSKLKYVDISGASYFAWIGPINFSGRSNQLETLILSNNKCSRISDNFFAKLTKLKYLDISYNVLGVFFPKVEGGKVFEGLESLTTLNMSGNFLEKLPSDLLKYQYNLQELVLSHNDMELWTLQIKHMKELRSIDCSFNRFVSLPVSIQADLDAIAENHDVHFLINNNKVICTCENLQFISWMIETKVKFSTHSKTCTQSDGTLVDILVANQNLKIICAKTDWTYPLVLSLFGLILSCVVGIAFYKKRWTIAYHWYLFRLRHKGYSAIDGKNDDFEFDAFLSFAEEDRKFVDKIIEELENGSDEKYHLCLHHRDFTPGVPIERNIVSAVHLSRKTIVFMSSSYLKSTWCNYELRMSLTKEGEANRKVIVMIILDNIPRKHLPLEVLQYYRKNCYVERPEKEKDMTMFFKTLKTSLKT